MQIAPYNYGEHINTAYLREAQMMTLLTPQTAMVVTTDIGNVADVHPKNKQEVGLRLALCALANTYANSDVVFSGPLYRNMKIEGDKIRLFFDHVDGGPVAKSGALTGFTIGGNDRKFSSAKAVIDGQTVLVSSDKVKQPVAVRFGWTSTAEPNLFNLAGLPASTFRTDNW